MLNFMIDIETLGNKQDAVILSIGCTQFDFKDGAGPYQKFYDRVNPLTQENRKIDASTAIWWLEQNEEARKEVCKKDNYPLHEVLSRLSLYLPTSPSAFTIWANGVTFDISILTHAYGGISPWDFRNVACMRTLRKIVPSNAFELPPTTVAHNALEDAIWQAEWVTKAVQYLGVK